MNSDLMETKKDTAINQICATAGIIWLCEAIHLWPIRVPIRIPAVRVKDDGAESILNCEH